MVIAVIAIMVGVALFLVVGITRKRNADPNQQHLARLLIDAAQDSTRHSELVNFIIHQPWSPKETRRRLAHAQSLAKIAAFPPTYERVREITLSLINASFRLG
jgi:hypothetical protein